jgi:hypothetical protein
VLVSRSNLQEQGVLADHGGVCRKGLTSAPAWCREYECTAEAHTGSVTNVKRIRGGVQQAGGRTEHRARFHHAADSCEKLQSPLLVAGIVSGDPAGWRGGRAVGDV